MITKSIGRISLSCISFSCLGFPRTPSKPPCTLGWRVLTRPSYRVCNLAVKTDNDCMHMLWQITFYLIPRFQGCRCSRWHQWHQILHHLWPLQCRQSTTVRHYKTLAMSQFLTGQSCRRHSTTLFWQVEGRLLILQRWKGCVPSQSIDRCKVKGGAVALGSTVLCFCNNFTLQSS